MHLRHLRSLFENKISFEMFSPRVLDGGHLRCEGDTEHPHLDPRGQPQGRHRFRFPGPSCSPAAKEEKIRLV